MTPTAVPRSRRRTALQLLAMVVAMLVGFPNAARADEYVSISGAGSTWSQVALAAWATDIYKNGIKVNYEGTGSTAGRQQFIYGTVDFGVSEIPFQPDEDPSGRPFAYLPVVAGGTSFMYHLTVAGKRVTDLRLSGETVTKIFTGLITNWNDPQITADYGKALPSIPIQPVVRSDGSGTSAQFSLYMATQYPSLWNDFCIKYVQKPNCGLQSFYPQFQGSKSQSGSNGVANYVAASYGEGAITYVEYAYALGLGFPVAKVLNAGGYYTSPTASNVAVALTKAEINDDLTQKLSGVYNNPDTRTYPLSSYSYMIVPTTLDAQMNEEKGKSLSTFINYFLCGGQQKAENLGYSPLPINLVQAGFQQVRRIPGFVDPPDGDLAACNNPTFQGGKNILLETAPYPSECDKAGSAPDCVEGGAAGPSAPAPTSPTGGGAAPVAGGSADPVSGGAGAAVPGQDPAEVAGGVDPETGVALGTGTTTDTGVAVAAVQEPGAFRNASAQTKVVYGLTAAELLLVVMIPPLMAVLLRRRRTATARDDAGPAS